MKVPVADLVCYALLTITVTATCTEVESTNTHALTQDKEKRISKRETTLLIENYPVESPKVIYRRVSRYPRPPVHRTKPKYGKSGPKHGSMKGYQSKRVTYRHVPATKHKKGRYPPRYSAPQRVRVKHSSAAKKKPHGSYKKPAIYHQDPAPYRPVPSQYPPEPIGFGEPPAHYGQSGLDTGLNDHDVPVDSYGAPIKTPSASDNRYAYNVIAAHDDSQAPMSNPSHHGHDLGGDFKPWNHNEENYEPAYAYSKKHPTYTAHYNHHDPVADNPYDDDNSDDTYSYFGQKMKERNRYKTGIKSSSVHYLKPLGRPGRLSSLQLKNPEPTAYDVGEEYEANEEEDHHVPAIRNHHSDHVVVGGQYAEPPARYVPKFQPSAAMAPDDEDNFRPSRHAEADMMSSATVSSYINYKNSNLAFSPQNLNDAFST